jgi:hypothetical protein
MPTSEATPADPPAAEPSKVVAPPVAAPTVPAPPEPKKYIREYKYQAFHGLKYGVKILERDPVTDKVLKVMCRFCIKNGVEHPHIYEVPLRPDKFRNHNRAMHEEWPAYEELEDDDAVSNFWNSTTREEEEAEAAHTEVALADAPAGKRRRIVWPFAKSKVMAASKEQVPPAPAVAAAYAPVLPAPTVAAVKAPAAITSAPTVSAAMSEKKNPLVLTSGAFKPTVLPKPAAGTMEAPAPMAPTVSASNTTTPVAGVLKPPDPLTGNSPTGVPAKAPIPLAPNTAASMTNFSPAPKIAPGVTVTSANGTLLLPKSPPKLALIRQLVLAPRISPAKAPGLLAPTGSTVGAPVRPEGPEGPVSGSSGVTQHGGASSSPALPPKKGVEYYMNVMGETNFVDFLLCREGIPFFQDPALVQGFRRKPPSQRKHAPTTPDRRKKGQPEAATPITSNKNKKRRRPEEETDDDDARPNPSHLTYDWESLGLGRTIGSAALNKRLCDGMRDEGGNDRVPQLSAIDCLHTVQQLKLRTVLPPANSELHTVLQKTRLQTKQELRDYDDAEEVSTKKGPCWKTIAELYQNMVAQDLDDGDIYRREYQFLKADQVKERMMRMETDASALQTREDRVRRTAATLGLLNTQTSTRVGEMLGDWQEDDKPSVEKCSYWDKDFPRVLRNGGEDTAFLTWHDVW